MSAAVELVFRLPSARAANWVSDTADLSLPKEDSCALVMSSCVWSLASTEVMVRDTWLVLLAAWVEVWELLSWLDVLKLVSEERFIGESP